MLLLHMLLQLVFATVRLPKALLASRNRAEVQSSTVVPRSHMSISVSLTCKR